MPRRRFINKTQLDRKQLLKLSHKAVVNLSSYELSNEERILLSRGLSFCPEPTYVNKFHIYRDTLLFNRRLRLKHHFKDTEHRDYDPFGVPTGWTPPVGKPPHLDTYINVTTREILDHNITPKNCTNLTNNEIQVLNRLRSNDNLIIKPADKGGAIVLIDKQDYINEGLRQLNNPQFYREVRRDPTTKTATDISKFLSNLKEKKLLPPHHINFLTPKNCRTSLFYLLPKKEKQSRQANCISM